MYAKIVQNRGCYHCIFPGQSIVDPSGVLDPQEMGRLRFRHTLEVLVDPEPFFWPRIHPELR